ncbi:hypothetical protein C6499_17920 [Candidatus Poribacteria bacterium]|nr:MAG: hypothetical protein C6499_17920 [Candidatus Poribacteria bacterium]
MSAYEILYLYHNSCALSNPFFTPARDSGVGPKAKALGLLDNALQFDFISIFYTIEKSVLIKTKEFLFYG